MSSIKSGGRSEFSPGRINGDVNDTRMPARLPPEGLFSPEGLFDFFRLAFKRNTAKACPLLGEGSHTPHNEPITGVAMSQTI